MKTIYVEPDEEIISVIDRVDRTEGKQVGLAIPKNAQIWQSSINLKLLKREADSSNKEVVLVISADLDSEIAERIGFEIKRVKDVQAEAELIRQEEEPVEEDPEEDSEEDPEEDKEEEIEIQRTPAKDNSAKQNMINDLVNKMEAEDDFHDTFKESLSHDRQTVLAGYRKKSSSKLLKAFNTGNLFSKKKGKRKSGLTVNLFSKKKGKEAWGKFFAGFVGLVVILAVLVFCFVLPSAKVTVYSQVETISFDLTVTGSKTADGIDSDSNIIPLQEIAIEQMIGRKFETTGEKELNEKASGIITIYNEYNSSPQILVATTRFRSPDGKIFRIPENVVVPGATVKDAKIVPSTLDVEVFADQPGEDYNIEPADFTIPGFKGSPKYVGFYGKSSESMAGGLIGMARVVLAEDLEKAEEELKEELINSAKESLQRQIPSGFVLIDGGIKEEIIEADFSAEENEAAESFTLDMKTEIKALAYKEENLRSIIDLSLLSQIADNKKIISESQQFDWEEVIVDWDMGEANLSLSAREDIAWDIDIPALKSDLAGKNEIEARKYFSEHSEIKKAEFSFWPFWVKQIPSRESRIRIVIEY